ncbi:ADP-ribosyl cyclase/cyclic ADP-ribose hydrolase 2-like [Halichondria panicea]|uniref:ADP-ribosyl cyclase/cyclic ADP-ribose hydrolase 2-like n=1 Tax=Halichondria panicea TaxID=6063 RepID=UPI00312B37A5
MWILLGILSLLAMVNGQEGGQCSPTPRNLEILYREECIKLLLRNTTCEFVWTRFTDAFAGMDPSQVTPQSYFPYFQYFGTSNSSDTSLFWTQTPELVEMLSCMCASGANIVSSANEPSTAIINNIERRVSEVVRWCGTTSGNSTDGIEYNMSCPCSVAFDFFEQFSVLFARAAQGVIFFLGYGEKVNGTFSESSFFAKYEIPNLNATVVTRVVVIVVHRSNQGEGCGQGTLNNLQTALKDQVPNIAYDCFDVFGDPTNSAEVQGLTNCTADIITSIQKGQNPENNTCSSGVPMQRLSLVIAVVAVLIAMCTL